MKIYIYNLFYELFNPYPSYPSYPPIIMFSVTNTKTVGSVLGSMKPSSASGTLGWMPSCKPAAPTQPMPGKHLGTIYTTATGSISSKSEKRY